MTIDASPAGLEPLRAATLNAAAMWTALAETRGHGVVRRPGFLAAEGGPRAGLRVLVLTPALTRDEVAEIEDLVRRREGRLAVEDPFGGLDLAHLGLAVRGLPVMMRPAGPAPEPSPEVGRVENPAQLEIAERTIVHGFPLESFQPHEPGEMLPKELLDREEFAAYLITREGEVAGACLTVTAHGVTGVYWVTTLPAHRSRGVARSLMHTVLAAPVPVTLAASTAGRPLYESQGFETLATSNWWSRR
ncbi:GNAT family N-acetyltransferase [Bailinhaonella thermotolerans]|uniref:GNAT family N-acetyltransferase n=1 Tax=Bailinhaonella thermotolerans TaxID=1070861 RepID=A0A3A4AGI2_9ACTN|nr:GNAT family N-acetyltransferase [Bailinhaonella thermotolerans]RJL24783.1 GNAT family N-acetyltransferase [Bailinhaonella thermotolerans]